MNVWLDDTRNPLTYGEGFNVADKATSILQKYGRDVWTWVKTVQEAKAILKKGGVSILSCDNDLGAGLEEGYTLLNWLEEKAATDPNFPIPDHIYAHTHNIDRQGPMQRAIENIKRFKSGQIK